MAANLEPLVILIDEVRLLSAYFLIKIRAERSVTRERARLRFLVKRRSMKRRPLGALASRNAVHEL